MTRREFLSTAGGTATAAAVERRLYANAASGVPVSKWRWVPPGEAQAPPDCVSALEVINKINKMPPDGTRCIDFKIPSHRDPIHRPRWSELKLEQNRDFRLQVIRDLNKAYDKMLSLPDDDCHSLVFQTCLHDFYCGGRWDGGDVHYTWDFLPWHRAFLYFQERIVARAACNPCFRMPIWDWETDSTIPDYYCRKGLPNFVTCPKRTPETNLAFVRHEVGVGATQSWLLSKDFPSFIGTQTEYSYLKCNDGPHSAIHTNVVQGPMTGSPTSAADPLFYSHHANVDRCFSYWLTRYRSYPRPDEWLDRCYYLYDEHHKLVRVRTRQILDESKLGYTYSDKPPVTLYDYFPKVVTDELWNNPIRLAELLTKLMLEMASAGLGALLSSARFAELPIRLMVTVPGQFAEPGVYNGVFLSNGKQESLIGGFGFFGHQMRDGTASIQVPIRGCIDSTIFDVLTPGNLLEAPAGGPLLISVRSRKGPAKEQKLALHDVSPFELLVPTKLAGLL
ncbi:MAG: tyrosinase family protein [Bryobacteraceae bacterium]|jgi:tyrosinase-like protein/polyphenol oxidase-like protein